MSQEVLSTTSNWTRILLSAFFSRMRLVILATVLCAVAAGAGSYLLPEVYSGSFSILIKSPEIDRSALGEHADISLRPGSVGGNVISDEYHILRSEGLAHAVAAAYLAENPMPESYLRATLPEWNLPGPGASVARKTTEQQIESLSAFFLDKMVVSPELKSDIIKVKMSFHDRAELQEMLELYASRYLQYRKQIWFNQEAQLFFGEQASKSLAEWRALSDELLALKARFHKIDPVIEKTELEEQISANLARLQSIQVRLDQYNEQLAALADLSPEDAITFFNDQTRDNRLFWQLKSDIGEAKAKRQELLKDHMAGSPLVRKADLQLGGLYEEYKKLIHSLIKNSIGMLETERDALLKNNRRGSDRIFELERIKQRVDVLQKRISLFERQYEVYENKAMSIEVEQLSRNALGTSVRIVSAPTVRSTPVWPDRTTLVVIASILGFFFALMTVVLLWMVRDAFHFPEDVTGYLGVPVLTTFGLEGGSSGPQLALPDNTRRLLSPGRLNVVLPGSRSAWYSALIFGSMLVSGWIIGSTLWPVWQQSHSVNAPDWVPRLVALFEKPARNPEPTDLLAGSGTPTNDRADNRTFTGNGATAPDMRSMAEVDDREIRSGKENNTEVRAADDSTLPRIQLAVFGVAPQDPPEADAEAASSAQVPQTGQEPPPAAGVAPAQAETASVVADNAEPIAEPEVPLASGKPDTDPAEVSAPAGSGDAATAAADLPAVDNPVRGTAVGTRTAAEPSTGRTRPGGDYFVQFGSFQEQARAKALRDRLIAMGYQVRVPTIASRKSAQRWYSVRADFQDLADAQRVRDEYFASEGVKPVLGKQPASSARTSP